MKTFSDRFIGKIMLAVLFTGVIVGAGGYFVGFWGGVATLSVCVWVAIASYLIDNQ